MGVLPRIGLVGIDLKRNRRPALTHRGDRLDVPPGFDLQLDAPVAHIHIHTHFFEEFLGAFRCGNPHAHAAIDFRTRRSEVVTERGRGATQPHIEHSGTNGSPSNVVPTNHLHGGMNAVGSPVLAQNNRCEVLLDHPYCPGGVFGVVARPTQRDALTPTLDAVTVDGLDQHHVTHVLGPETRAERPHQWHLQ